MKRDYEIPAMKMLEIEETKMICWSEDVVDEDDQLGKRRNFFLDDDEDSKSPW